jgi:A/G-specific adenine glycosylase
MYAWRRTDDPYRVLVSEVMLQQTQAARVDPAFERFVRIFPTVTALAQASTGDVLRAWAGLGYNRRAISLVRAAQAIVRDHGGAVPYDVDVLERLPGVGPYTAAAVASLAFRQRVAAVDTNVRRVVARAALGKDPREVSARSVHSAAASLVDEREPGAWNQALMDLGREVCRPVPRCGSCPLRRGCRYRVEGRRGTPPVRPKTQGFEGSVRQLRGRVVRELLSTPSVSLGQLCSSTGQPRDRVAEVVRALASEGMVRAGSAALGGRPGGRVRLA